MMTMMGKTFKRSGFLADMLILAEGGHSKKARAGH
jgi:hypothetical protein